MEVPDVGDYAREKWPLPQKRLAAMITRLDQHVGRLVAKLRRARSRARHRRSCSRRTTVRIGRAATTPDFFDSNGPLRGIKRDLYEGGIRVPLIVRWTGRTKPGTESDQVGFLGDFLATAAEIAKAPPPVDHTSISFLPSIVGDRQGQRTHAVPVLGVTMRPGSSQAVRLKNWKALRSPMFSGRIGSTIC